MKTCNKFLALAVISFCLSTKATASHSWNGYHWARVVNPFTIQVRDNTSSTWAPYLQEASLKWGLSEVLDIDVVPTSYTRSCKAINGQVVACSARYGYTGWLGIAQVWMNGSHITQALVKMNDSYFISATYNTPAWRRLVMNQEVGHTFGLDHQDEVFDNPNLGTCMDYTNDPDGIKYNQLSNEYPNQHDYDELTTIYLHTDPVTTLKQSLSVLPISEDLPAEVTSKRLRKFTEEFSDETTRTTFIFWIHD